MGQARPEATPNVYGRYETLFRIAAGGMAEVYAARVRGEAGFQKLVALKRMLPHLTDDERFVNMFMDEGKLAANISSPNVVSTLDLGRADDGSLFLVMELVVGTTLSTLLRNTAKESASVPLDVAVELIAQAAQGLHDAHDAKTPYGAPLHIVHRDVSPQNILVGTDGRVRITDFGVARAILRRTKTSTGEFKGKLSYFSPEQCADRDLDRRSDVFSLGVVAWETLTTRRLFHAENPLAVLERVTRMPIPPANTVNPAVPHAIAAVVERALERDRDVRFASAAEFARALRAAARETVGVRDTNVVAEMVQRYGGETLERMQISLKQSLGEPGTAPAILLPDDKTEISSGIVFRAEDGAIAPATPPAHAMISSTGASFIGVPVELGGRLQSGREPEVRAPSKAPFVIAAIVAMVGLAAGAVMGILAATREPAPIPTEVRVLPPEGAEGAALEIAAEPAAVEALQPTVEPPPAPEPQPAQRIERGRTPRRDRGPRAPVPAPEVRPLTDTPRTELPQRDPPRTTAQTPAAPSPTAPAPQRPRGLVGLDGFDRDIGGR